jgi:hypothetical protein
MSQGDKIQLEQLEALGKAFSEMLVPCLEECARGRWGLFGVNDHVSDAATKYLAWPEADRVRDLAVTIQSTLAQFGESNVLCDEFLELCTIHGENDPGEPMLARTFLDRIEKGEVGTKPVEERRPW